MLSRIILGLLPLSLFLFTESKSQTVIANFIAPDTVCVGELITLTNTSTGGSSYYWNFCSGSANNDPSGTNIGNPGTLLNVPVYPTLVKQGNDCFSFINNQLSSSGVVRYYHGTSFSNNPISWQSLGRFGLLTDSVEGMQVIYDDGLWYGFICNGHRLLRLEFGASLWNNNPVATSLGPYDMFMGHCLKIIKEGDVWLGFVTCSFAGELGRFTFGNSLANLPTYVNLGNLAAFLTPCQFTILEENGLWYIILLSSGNNSICRLSFGSSLLNTPTGINLGNVGGLSNSAGMAVIRDCENTSAYYCNYIIPGAIGKIVFPEGVTGPASGQLLGNIGNLNRPNCFSEIIREHDSLLTYITNRQNGTLTRLYFPPCNNATVPSSTQFNPPLFAYNQTGVYNVQLIVDEGLATQSAMCKNIVVEPAPVTELGADRIICPGSTTTLDAGSGFTSYLWSTGATVQSIMVDTSGTFWVKVTRYGCEDYDTLNVSLYPVAPLTLGPDTTICEGLTYTFIAGACMGCAFVWSNLTLGLPNIGTDPSYTTGTAGTYMVTRSDAYGCIRRDTAVLSLSPPPVITTNPLSQTICSGASTTIQLTANIPGTNFSWDASCTVGDITGFSAGTGTTINQILTNILNTSGIVSYIITPEAEGCWGIPDSITVLIKPRPDILFMPSTLAICSGTTTAITISSQTPGTSFSWIALGSSPDLTGFSNGMGSIIAQTLVNSGYLEEEATYIVTPEADGCPGNDSPYSVTVFPVTQVICIPDGDTICSGKFTSLTLQSNVSGTTYSWTATGSSPNVSGYSAGSGSFIAQQLFTTGIVAESVIYKVFPSANNCPGTDDEIVVGISPTPDVTLSLCEDILTTTSAKPVSLRGGIPLHGTYSGAGVSDGKLYPALTGAGTHLITYSCSNMFGCETSANQTITIVNPISHQCGDPVTDIRDGQSYPTVEIGTQCWLAKNLNFGAVTPGSTIQRDNCIAEKFCFQQLLSNCTNYGGLYQWDELMTYRDEEQIQGLCLPGWHIPSQNDWEVLFVYYINNAFAGSPLLYSGYSGYNALLSGGKFINLKWDFEGFATMIWTSTAHGPFKAWAHGMNDYDHGVSSYPGYRLNALSVRCLKD